MADKASSIVIPVPIAAGQTTRGGWHHTPITRAKISLARRGKRPSPETLAKLRALPPKGARVPGWHHSDSARQMIAAAKRGKPMSAEARQHMSESKKAWFRNPENRERHRQRRTQFYAEHPEHRAALVAAGAVGCQHRYHPAPVVSLSNAQLALQARQRHKDLLRERAA